MNLSIQTVSRYLVRQSAKTSKILKYLAVLRKFRRHTMIEPTVYIQNLMLAEQYKHVDGCVVECGTWRGGMIGGMAKLLGDREYYLFDSFEGLPAATDADGIAAKEYQANTTAAGYYDNCKAEISFAENAMKLSGVKNYHIVKGWFSETLPAFDKTKKIAILRLDGDWYESTMDCLTNLFDSVVPGGVIIFDDYYTWEGCAKAVHDFFSQRGASQRIWQSNNSICYIKK